MKNLIILLFCIPVMLFGQDANAPNLYEVITMEVKRGQEDAFEAAVKAHNEKFHGEGMYPASLNYNINGPWGGQYTWIMGPTSWTAMDTRPGKGAHDDDWKNVDQYVESYDGPGYWSMSSSLSHIAEGPNPSKRLIWVYDIKSGEGTRWTELVGQVKEVYAEKFSDEHFWVVWNEFSDTAKGWDVAVIFPFEKWAWMDEDNNFRDKFEEVHGKNTWDHFLDEFRTTINGRVDWLRETVE